jgi:ABC-2 type transport system permease protein
MNTPSNNAPEFEPLLRTSSVLSPTRPFYWSMQRELWEFRSIYLAPLAVAAAFLFGFVISIIHLPAKMRALDPMKQHELIMQPYNSVALAIMAATFLVSIFYCLEALHGERRDRSILFWKSLPVSDLTAVLSKASIPLVILPLLTFMITVVTHFFMVLLGSAVLLGSGQSATAPWSHMSLFQLWLMLLYHLVAIHALWFAPFYGWMLLVSAWARRAPFLWATVPLLAIGVVEKIAFNGSYLSAALIYRLGSGPEGVPFATGNMAMSHSMSVLPPWKFLLSPGLWLGLAITAGFLFAAARIRRNRGPI